MDSEELLYQSIAEAQCSQHEHVAEGKMMSRPAIQYKGKVFAFYRKKHMVFKLGDEYSPEEHGIASWTPLNPFKTKPPLKGWFCIPFDHQDRWPGLTDQARAYIAADVDG